MRPVKKFYTTARNKNLRHGGAEVQFGDDGRRRAERKRENNKSPDLNLLGVSAVVGQVSVDRKRRAGRGKRGYAGHPVAQAVGIHREGAIR